MSVGSGATAEGRAETEGTGVAAQEDAEDGPHQGLHGQPG